MLELEENLKFLNELKNKLEEIKDSMKIESLKHELKELEKKSLEENFWNDQENSSLVFCGVEGGYRDNHRWSSVVKSTSISPGFYSEYS